MDAGRVPPRYRQELTAAVGALAASISCSPPLLPDPAEDDDGEGEGEDEDDEDDDDGKGKKSKGKKGGRG